MISLYNYFWGADSDKEGISFSDAIRDIRLDRDEALECLKRAGHPINNDDDILSLRQYELLKRESWDKLMSEIKEAYNSSKDDNEKRKGAGIVDCLEYMAVHGMPIKGINNHKVESKAVLRERLEEIAKSPTEYFDFDGAMCYSRAFPNIEVTFEHICPTCGTKYKYKGWGFDDFDNPDRYNIEEKRIDKFVDEIKALGYDVFAEHMCEKCYKEKYGKDENSVSINVLNFKHIGDENYIINTVSSESCMILAEFLKGNNAFRGHQDETIWINKHRDFVETLLGIKVEEK